MTGCTHSQIRARRMILFGVLMGLLAMMGTFSGHLLPRPAHAAPPTPTPAFTPPHEQALRAARGQASVSPLTLYHHGNAPETMTVSWVGDAYALQLQGTRLYVVQGGYFRIYDVRDPGHPRLLDELLLVPNGGVPNGSTLRLADHYAYVRIGFFSGSGYSAMIDLNSSPLRVVAVDPPVWDTGCNQDGVFFNLVGRGRMDVWDLSDPRHFRQLAAESVVSPGFYLWECEVQDDVLYVSSSGGLTMVDVSDPAHPRPLATFDVDIHHAGNIAIQDGWAYVATQWVLYVVDVHDPSHPREVQRISFPFSTSGSELIALGDRLYRLTSESGGVNRLAVYDIASPADIRQLTVTFLPNLHFSARMQISPEHVLFASGRGGWVAYDLHDLDAIAQIAAIHFPHYDVIDIARAGPCLILAVEPTLATLVDGCDPRHPQPLWADDALPNLIEMTLFRSADRFFIATPGYQNASPAVRVYDHRDLRAPRFERQITDMFQYEGGFAAWDSLLAGLSPDGDRLRIIDLSRPPGQGLIYNGLLPDQSPQVLAAYNGMLFLQSRDEQGYWQLVQYDVTDPMRPRRTGGVRINALPAQQMLFYRDVAYLTVKRGQKTYLTLARVSPHAPPQALGDFHPSDHGLGVDPRGERLGHQLVYVSGFKTTYETTFQTWWIDVSDPAHPRVERSRGGVGNPALLFEPYQYGVVDRSLSAVYAPLQGDWMQREVARDALGPIYAVAAWGPDRALIGGNGRLWVYDVSDPAQPQRLGETDAIGGLVQGVAVQEDTAYLAVGDRGVAILSLADPTRPQVVRWVKTTSFAWNVSLAGEYLYVAEARGYAIYRLLTPTQPAPFRETNTAAWDIAPAGDIYAWGNASYAGVSRFPTEFVFSDQGWTPGVAADSRHVYAARGFEGVKMFDHDGSNPRQYPLPGYAMDLVPRGDQLFVVDWMGALHRLDLAAPDRVDTLTFPARAWGLSLGERFLFVSLPQVGVAVIDPDALTQMGLIALPTLQASAAWTPDGSRVIVGGEGALARFDLDHPDEPLAWLELPDTLTALDGAGSWLYAAAGDQLLVISGAQTGPLTIVHARTFDAPIRQVAAQPPNLYVLTGDRAVHLLDIRAPHQPQELGRFETAARIEDMAASGRVLYLAQDDRLLRVIDWTDPAQPQVDSDLVTAQTPAHLEADGNLLIFKERDEGFSVFDISDPRAPQYRFTMPATLPVRTMALRDGKLAVTYENDRVSLYQVDVQRKQFAYLTTGMEPSAHTEVAIPLDDILITVGATGDLHRFRLPPKQIWMPQILQAIGK